MQIKIIIVWVLAVVLLADSVLRSFRSNFNFGLLLMYLLTAALWAYAVFHRPIDAFCAEGVGRWLKMLFFCGAGVFCLLLGFVAVSGYAGAATGQEKASWCWVRACERTCLPICCAAAWTRLMPITWKIPKW